MERAESWKRLGDLSRMLQAFRRMYVRREVEEDNPSLLKWRHELASFFKVRACWSMEHGRHLLGCRRLWY